ncbi:MAG: 2-oxoglutarate-acceptor oxidoreductase subunit OorD [Methanosaeta sp. PtaB.Bin018]|nr:ferredoxin family protein [Methanothrix sp.]OPX74695.1 MAG: 2-oxoglutarate-acceptor oxidoreductase subunit OorD [Methanosaeta sp. PtaB.Bin018]OPY47719.1 MAG: 2-oxoglutarate-acceptor oxidoreductase subunit OorD [Methanosaeta sp. PtaU1.Bin016]
MLKKSANSAAWAMMANMPTRLKAEVAIKMLLAGSDETKRREIMHSVSERRRLTVPRDEIPWHPSIDQLACKRCKICLNFCPKGVYSEDSDGSIVVTHPHECVMLCTGCEGRCPEGAISFPDRKDFYKYVYYV